MSLEDNQNSDCYWLAGTIEAFQEKMAVIITKDGQKLLWPIKNLPEGCQAGSPVRLVLSTAQSDQAERQQIAKTILNEILKSND